VPIIDLQRRLREAGRIRIGNQVAAKDRNGNDTTRPAKLDKFRFTSADKQSMLAIAELCGGEVTLWADAPVGEQFELYSDCKCLDVLVPPVDLAFSQWMECWSGGGCKKRCDGQTNVINDTPCSCDPDNPECKPTTRLGVILTAIQGIGIWRLELHGWNGASELNGAIEVLRVIQGRGAMVPARLLLEQRQSQKDGKTYNFAVPVLDLNLSVAALTGGARPAAIESGVTPIAQPATRSIGDQVAAVETPVAKPARANAAEVLPPTHVAPRPAAAASSEPLLTEPQGRNIARLFNKIKITDRQERLDFLAEKFNHPFTTSKELTKAEASTLIEALMLDAGEEPKPRRTATPPPVSDEPPPDDFGGYSDEPW